MQSTATVYGASSQPQISNYGGQQAFLVTIPTAFTTTNPEITLRVKGSFIGVVIPKGIPKILSATSAPFSSGANGSIDVNVENIGTSQGTFYYSLSDCAGVSTVSSQKYSVPAGQNQEINIPIYTSGANQTINQQCTVTVTDSNGGGSSTAQVNVVSKPANQCTPNTQVQVGQSFCPCIQNATGVWKLGLGTACTTCQYGVIASASGSYTCAPPPTTIGSQSTIVQQSTTTIPQYNNSFGHKDVVIVTIGSNFNQDSNYINALSSYESVLTSEGLSYVYVNLSSYNPNMNANSWVSVKSTINRIEYLTNATYLIILGNENIVPMPTISSLGVNVDDSGYNSYIIPTDDPYGSLTNSSVPTIVVARIPGSNADEIASILSNDTKRHSETNNNLLISGDELNDQHDSFIGGDVNTFSEVTTGSSCASNSNCLSVPPYCLGSSCTSASNFQTDISSVYGIQYYDCHGSGYSCGTWSGNYTTLSTFLYWSASSIPQLNTNPIILSAACYDGITEPSNTTLYYYLIPGGTTPLALQMLEDGASAYIGNTKEGFGGYTPTNLEYIYNKFKSGETIGQAFLSMKRNFLTNSPTQLQRDTAQELQLYGDPTLTYG